MARERFATTLDVYLLLCELPEDTHDFGTADGRPTTVACAHARLARLRCASTDDFSLAEARRLAREAAESQQREILAAVYEAVWHLGEYPAAFIVSGSGEFLAKRTANRYDHVARKEGKGMNPWWYRCSPRRVPVGTPRPRQVVLSARLGDSASIAACAYAVAVLAAERPDA
jgi:hypothetical protein